VVFGNTNVFTQARDCMLLTGSTDVM